MMMMMMMMMTSADDVSEWCHVAGCVRRQHRLLGAESERGPRVWAADRGGGGGRGRVGWDSIYFLIDEENDHEEDGRWKMENGKWKIED